MDRREMLKGAGGAFAATSLGMSGLSEAVRAGEIPDSVAAARYAEESLRWRGNRPGVALEPLDPSIRGLKAASPYDPVAVLEAMRERGYECWISMNDHGGTWVANWEPPAAPYDYEHETYPGWNQEEFPDFLSAVRWLHAQAAAADPGFSEKFPLPTE